LCGKSLDLAWLAARGHHVIGVEIVPRAIEAFFAEHRLEPRREEHGGHPVWRAPGLEIHEADILSLDPGVFPPADALWDRAALIALPAAERGPYASLMLRLLHETSPILLVSLEYDQHAMEGPPYSVPEAEIRTHFGAVRTIDLLESRDALDGNPRFREVGLRDVLEKVYLLR
jgi:thiopurine S-methyltransferase